MSGPDLKDGLRNFIGGTNEWHTYSALFPWALLTDGTKWLAENAGAYWLMDLICSHQPAIRKKFPDRHYFQSWSLTVNEDRSCVAVADDGDGLIMAKQEIEFTDFPMDSIKLYCSHEDERVILLLPCEY